MALYSNSAGAPAGRAGDKGSTCISCHNSYSLGDNNTAVSITLKDANNTPVTDLTGGVTYTVEVSVSSGSNFATGGFELTAVATGSSNSDPSVGTFSGSNMVQKISQGNRDYVTHIASKPSVQNNTITWTFSWTAPSAIPANGITFYAAGIAANGNGRSNGDYVGANSVAYSGGATGMATTEDKTFHAFWENGQLSVAVPENGISQAVIYSASGQAVARFSNLQGQMQLPFHPGAKGMYWIVGRTKDGKWLRSPFLTQ